MAVATSPRRLAIAVIAAIAVGGLAAEEGVAVTGHALRVNGHDRIPVGMFGVHATKIDAERIRDWGIESVRQMVWSPGGSPLVPGAGAPEGLNHIVECFWDRYHPALQLTNPKDWERRLVDLGTSYGAKAATTGFQHHIEFWNEPYLNWASKPGVNYDPRYYQREGVQEGDPVTIRGLGAPTEYLVWKPGYYLQWEDGNPRDSIDLYVKGGNFLGGPFDGNLRRGAQVGQVIEFQGKRMLVREQLVPFDPTQFGREKGGNRWWSGRQNGLWYNQMITTFGRALKDTNPDVKLAGGWGFHFSQGGWEAWADLYKPMLEAGIDVIDAVHEHHYGGDTRMVAANYEVVWNWAMAAHGKRLEFWNTEAGGQLDPQRPDVVEARPTGGKLERARGAATYTMRDILYLLHWSPDRATARAAHEAHHNGGDAFAFRMLKPLRGELYETTTSSRDFWTVAAREDDRLTVVIWNDRDEAVTLPLTISPPRGFQLAEGAMATRLGEDTEAELLTLVEEPLGYQAADGWSGSVNLEAKAALRLVLPLRALPQGGAFAPTTIEHIASERILAWFGPDEPWSTTFTVDAKRLAAADEVALRIAVVGYDGETEPATLTVNGHAATLQPGNWLMRQVLDQEMLGTEIAVTVTPTGQPFGIWAASLELVDRPD